MNAWAPSRTGLALVGAYILAGEPAAPAGQAEAFDACDRVPRPFTTLTQALANVDDTALFPRHRGTPAESATRHSTRGHGRARG